MKKVIILFLLMFSFVISLSAIGVSHGFYGGAGLSSYLGRPDINAKYNFTIGGNIGYFVSFEFSRAWAIETDILWNMKNTSMSQEIYNGSTLTKVNRTIEEQLTVINFPVLLRYSLLYERSSFDMLAGFSPQLNYERFYDISYNDTQDSQINNDSIMYRRKEAYVGLTSGIQYRFALEKDFLLFRLISDWMFMDDQGTNIYAGRSFVLHTINFLVGYQF